MPWCGFLMRQPVSAAVSLNVRDRSNVNDFVCVLAEIPARAIAKMRKQGMDAGINLLLTGFVLNLAILDVNGVKRVNRNLRKLRSPSRDLETQRNVVAQVKQPEQSHER
jgi:hypothetical protein